MQQSSKKSLNLICSIVNIMMGALLILISIIGILNCVSIYCDDYRGLYSTAAFVLDLVFQGIDIAIGALIILFGSLSLVEKHSNKRSFAVTLLVFFGLWFASSIILNAWLGMVLCLIAIGLNISVIVVKEPNESVNATAPKKSFSGQNSLESKIAELKHYKEIGIITEEQYEEAVK